MHLLIDIGSRRYFVMFDSTGTQYVINEEGGEVFGPFEL